MTDKSAHTDEADLDAAKAPCGTARPAPCSRAPRGLQAQAEAVERDELKDVVERDKSLSRENALVPPGPILGQLRRS